CRHPLRGFASTPPKAPRVRGLTRGYMPPPASRVRVATTDDNHGFADSPVARCRHPLRGFASTPPKAPRVRGLTRGYMPPPASRVRVATTDDNHGFADSPVATCRHPLRGCVSSVDSRLLRNFS